jgi:hypothetical protein
MDAGISSNAMVPGNSGLAPDAANGRLQLWDALAKL